MTGIARVYGVPLGIKNYPGNRDRIRVHKWGGGGGVILVDGRWSGEIQEKRKTNESVQGFRFKV